MKINFDMDNTLCALFDVEGWLTYIENENTTPYEIAKPSMNMSLLARYLNRLQKMGYEINIITWLAKDGREDYNARVATTKMAWLEKHLASVHFDNIHIVKYGVPKHNLENGILFDDDVNNRIAWAKQNGNIAYDVDNIIEELKKLF